MFLDKIIGEVAGACGIGGGEQNETQKAGAAKKSGGFEQIGDSFKNGDIMGGINQILGMCTGGMGGMGGMGGGGGMNITEMMNPMMFMDPISKKIFEELSKQGYAKPASTQSTAAKPPADDEKYASALQQLDKNFDAVAGAGIGGKDGFIDPCDLQAAASNTALPAELRQACQYLLSNPAAFNKLDVAAGIGQCDGHIGKCDVEAALKALPKKAEPAKTSGETKAEGTGGSSKTSDAKAGSTYQEKWSEAVHQLKDNFDLLDTASGLGGKDGLIGRCDLEAAVKNPDLPAELRAACQFLLNNPAAFNQLDVGAGIGNCDGLIGKCDVDAVLKTLPKKTEPAKTDETKKTSGSDTAKADGKGGTSKSNSKDDAKKVGEEEVDVTEAKSTGSHKVDHNRFDGMSVEEIIEELMFGMDDDLVDTAEELRSAQEAYANAEKGSTAEKTASKQISQLERKMQTLLERRSQMFNLLSNLSKINNEMSNTAINNMGRI